MLFYHLRGLRDPDDDAENVHIFRQPTTMLYENSNWRTYVHVPLCGAYGTQPHLYDPRRIGRYGDYFLGRHLRQRYEWVSFADCAVIRISFLIFEVLFCLSLALFPGMLMSAVVKLYCNGCSVDGF